MAGGGEKGTGFGGPGSFTHPTPFLYRKGLWEVLDLGRQG